MEHKNPDRSRNWRPNKLTIAATIGVAVLGALVFVSHRQPQVSKHGQHHNITTTVFWVGEGEDASNGYIPNRSSTWIEDWVGAFGGVDDPNKRCGFGPCGFTPKENAFYFALPYNDLDDNCNAKPSQRSVPWYAGPPGQGESIVKNQWIQIQYNGKTAYAQWQDAGPFGEDDTDYVFGKHTPKAHAGLDVSPATASYLGLPGEGKTSWQFITPDKVPEGPWHNTITVSRGDCAS